MLVLGKQGRKTQLQKKTHVKRKNIRNEKRHSEGVHRDKIMEMVVVVVDNTELLSFHINKGIHQRCLLRKGEINLCCFLYLHFYFCLALIGNLDQNNDILVAKFVSFNIDLHSWFNLQMGNELILRYSFAAVVVFFVAKDENVSYYLHT